MKSIIEYIKKDLTDLKETDNLSNAISLNNKLDLKKQFVAPNCVPMYYNGKFDAATVLVMLNPGFEKVGYSFNADDNYSGTVDEIIKKYINNSTNYWEISLKRGKIDSFDLKQAAFLYHFSNSEIEIPNFFESTDKRLEAQTNVLKQKLQLELIPYCSREFKGVLDNQKLATKNIEVFKPFIERIFDAIIEHPRENVVFCAKQFLFLMIAYKNAGYGDILLGDESCWNVVGLQKKVYFRKVTIKYKLHTINAGIAYSFPRRDLPHAYKQMSEYGRLCFLELSK